MATKKTEPARPGFKTLRLPRAPAETAMPNDALTAAALLELSDTIAAVGRPRPNALFEVRNGPPLPIFQIPVACKGVYDAVTYKDGSATRRVGTLSSTAIADATSAEAYDAALQDAKDNAQADLDNTFNNYFVCDTGCSKARDPASFEIVSADVTASYGAFFAWIAYTWTITVRAKQKMKCV